MLGLGNPAAKVLPTGYCNLLLDTCRLIENYMIYTYDSASLNDKSVHINEIIMKIFGSKVHGTPEQ
jgi:hypothetical protein